MSATANPYTNDPATERQHALIAKLGGDTLYAHKLSKKEASTYIDELKAHDKAANDVDPEYAGEPTEVFACPPPVPNRASDAQLRFVKRLWDERDMSNQSPVDFDTLTKRDASKLIDVLKERPPAQGKQLALDAPAPSVDEELSPGVYKLDGIVYIVKPNKTKTRLYAKKLVESAGTRVSETGEHIEYELEYAPGVIFKLSEEHRMPFEEAKALTARYGRCIVCGRHLKAAESVEKGIGPKCAKSFKH